MKLKTLERLLLQTLSAQRLGNKLETNFYIKNGSVFYLRNGKEILFENDLNFFEKFIKTKEIWKFSSLERHFTPTEKDWEIVKREYRTILLDITSRCNSDCKICFKKACPDDDMDLEDVKYILSKIGKNKSVMLFGGEPTVHEKIFDILSLIRKSGNVPMVYTNGLKLADPFFVKRLKECGVKRFHFSFDGFTEEVYEKMRTNPKHLYLKLKALDNIREIGGMNVYLCPVIIPRINDNQIPQLLKFAIKYDFIKSLYLFQPNPYEGRFDVGMPYTPTWSDIIKLLNKADPGITIDYCLEFERLKYNITRLADRLRLPFKFDFVTGVVYEVNDGLKEIIPTEELAKINESLESGKYQLFFEMILKHFKLSTLFNFLMRPNFKSFRAKDYIYITAAHIYTKNNYIPFRSDTIIIGKSLGFTPANPV